MNRRILVAATAIIALATFGLATFLYDRDTAVNTKVPVLKTAQSAKTANDQAAGDKFIRLYSPVIGSKDAPVTIVEFFDPACEACRAIHPYVKQIMSAYSGSVRLVMRYAAFHKGSDEAVRILETARLQGVFKPVLEALLEAQPVWAAHGNPDLSKAWEAAGAAGLDVTRARKDMLLPGITATLNQDMADVKTIGVRLTPTFFVNRKPLPSFGPQQLADLVHSEVKTARKALGE